MFGNVYFICINYLTLTADLALMYVHKSVGYTAMFFVYLIIDGTGGGSKMVQRRDVMGVYPEEHMNLIPAGLLVNTGVSSSLLLSLSPHCDECTLYYVVVFSVGC
jgi:hypothetical protein